tara:strand:+ start:13111 stop:13764 length:654 start_codon:yes stop_codon:yes gene_type:complete
MKIRCFIFYIILFLSINLFSQENQRYFEDQFYLGLTYNSLGGKVEDFKENKFSYSLNYGFIKDIPVTKSGKIAFGLGLGFSHNSLNNNLKFKNPGFEFEQNVGSFNINRYNYTEFQIPFEIRWRNSSDDNYKFWRIYSGLRYSRVINSKYTYRDDTLIDEIDFLPINKNQLGLTLNIGFNTWNISLYQSLNSFFNPEINNNIKDLKQFRLGIIFYIF